jgi:hypothetical protein
MKVAEFNICVKPTFAVRQKYEWVSSYYIPHSTILPLPSIGDVLELENNGQVAVVKIVGRRFHMPPKHEVLDFEVDLA